jgi:subtilase family serine protease
MGLRRNRRMAGAAAGMAVIAICGTLGATAAGASAAGTGGPATVAPGWASVAAVPAAASGPASGAYQAARMSVEVLLAPRDQAGLNRKLTALYAHPRGRAHWLAKGQFAADYGPSAAGRRALTRYLRARHLAVSATASPFLLRAEGTSAQVAAAFRTTLRTYRGKKATYFANAAPARLPRALAARVTGVIGLANTVREHAMIIPAATRAAGAAAARPAAASCEQPYPSRARLIAIAKSGEFPLARYGAGPGCSGLTPSQVNSIYGAPAARPRTRGQGVTLAVFELSGYQRSDIAGWAATMYGPSYRPRLTDVNVDGGPLTPRCPLGDTCPAEFNGYSGDIEVDADIEMQLAVAPDALNLMVYNAPNDFTGQTELDEYARIAGDDQAAAVSSSWGECENDAGPGYVQAENLIFEQMAMQGQSMFASSGDDGAFGCLTSDGTSIVNVLDPEAQPWVTSAGGTSLETFNPGQSARPAYPAGTETVWNPASLCGRRSAAGEPGYLYCATNGASGGGSSQFWGRPAYQHGPGVTNKFTTFGNGTTHCALAAVGTPCREVPDISVNADEFTPYAEYCTGGLATPYSFCAGLLRREPAQGWLGIGGTSLSAPLWSAIVADRDSYRGRRSGNINPLLYQLYRTHPARYFHDIAGTGQSVRDNGLFPTVPGYDLATGIGTPKMAALITDTP